MENVSSIPISVFVIVAIWLAMLASILVSKYKNRESTYLQDTDRRRGHRRSDSEINTVEKAEVPENPQRRKDDRRANKDWKNDFREIRDRIEEEMAPKDF